MRTGCEVRLVCAVEAHELRDGGPEDVEVEQAHPQPPLPSPHRQREREVHCPTSHIAHRTLHAHASRKGGMSSARTCDRALPDAALPARDDEHPLHVWDRPFGGGSASARERGGRGGGGARETLGWAGERDSAGGRGRAYQGVLVVQGG